MKQERTYIAIDLKSFFASVECVERGLDPLSTNLLVADEKRTDKTICLAVSPSLKAYGLGGRCRLFEAKQKIREVNAKRLADIPDHTFTGESWDDNLLRKHPDWKSDFIIAKPRMGRYLEYSRRICSIYENYVSNEDIHIYSIDEVFIDATEYLATYETTAHSLTVKMIKEVLRKTGITATAGIGTNLYLCKVAMDIAAKAMPADNDGVRIAEFDEMTYRRKLWDYQPLTKFWRVGHGMANKLARYGLLTMGQVARCSIENEDLLYQLFGVNAELLIDHAWGWEPCTMEYVKSYRPESHSMSSGQVLQHAYDYDKARIVVAEMAEETAMNLVRYGLLTNQLTVSVGYDRASIGNHFIAKKYDGDLSTDRYGRTVPKHDSGTANLNRYTSSTEQITKAAMSCFERIVKHQLLVRRLNITANNVISEEKQPNRSSSPTQLDLFTDYDAEKKRMEKEKERCRKEKKMQKTLLDIKRQYGKNSILKGLNFEDGATAKERNGQIGGHRE